MIISVPPLSDEKEETIDVEIDPMPVNINYGFPVVPTDGLQIPEDQYIIDPDYMEILKIDNFEDLIRNK